MQILSLLLGALLYLDEAYKAIIGVLWIALIKYGLSPIYVFLVPFTTYSPYSALEGSLNSGLFFQFSILIIILASVIALAFNSFAKPHSGFIFLVRALTAIILGAVSFVIVTTAFSGLNAIYSILYNSANIDWSNFLLFSSTSGYSGTEALAGGSFTVLIDIFALTGYFVSSISLFAILMLRQALLLLCLLILPFATVLMAFNYGTKFAKVVWEIVVEMSVYPFLVLASLYLAHIFSWDAPLQLAFLFLPSLIPGFLLASGRGFLSTPVMGFIGGMSLSSAVGKGLEGGSIISGAVKGAPLGGTLAEGAKFPLSDSTLRPNLMHSGKTPEEMPWKELLREELKYRKK